MSKEEKQENKLFFDYKVTSWRRIYLSDESKKEEILKILEENKSKILESNNLAEYIPDFYDKHFVQDELLYEISEDMTPDMNEGQATIFFGGIKKNEFHKEISNRTDILWTNKL